MADQNLPFDDILTGDLSQFSITEEDIAAASATEEFADTGEVSVPDSMPYLEFDSALLLRRLLPFKQKKASANDIVTRSLLIEVMELQLFSDRLTVFLFFLLHCQ